MKRLDLNMSKMDSRACITQLGGRVFNKSETREEVQSKDFLIDKIIPEAKYLV